VWNEKIQLTGIGFTDHGGNGLIVLTFTTFVILTCIFISQRNIGSYVGDDATLRKRNIDSYVDDDAALRNKLIKYLFFSTAALLL
jgi:hypothetical protein